jgi:hypothetical protein
MKLVGRVLAGATNDDVPLLLLPFEYGTWCETKLPSNLRGH